MYFCSHRLAHVFLFCKNPAWVPPPRPPAGPGSAILAGSSDAGFENQRRYIPHMPPLCTILSESWDFVNKSVSFHFFPDFSHKDFIKVFLFRDLLLG